MVFNDQLNDIQSVDHDHVHTLEQPSPEMKERARRALENRLVDAWERTVRKVYEHPALDQLVPGTEVRLTDEIRNQISEEDICQKCNGTGIWTNPLNAEDKRKCLSCKEGISKFNNKKTDDGKPVWIRFPENTTGVVLGTNTYTINRKKITTINVLIDNQAVRVPPEKLALIVNIDKEIIRKQAKAMSFTYCFNVLHPMFKWEDNNTQNITHNIIQCA
jgi:ribosomal protein L40E